MCTHAPTTTAQASRVNRTPPVLTRRSSSMGVGVAVLEADGREEAVGREEEEEEEEEEEVKNEENKRRVTFLRYLRYDSAALRLSTEMNFLAWAFLDMPEPCCDRSKSRPPRPSL